MILKIDRRTLLYLYLISYMFIPFMTYSVNRYNIEFIFPNIFALLFLIEEIFSQPVFERKYIPLIIFDFIYLSCFLAKNIDIGCYWDMVNRVLSIAFFIVLSRYLTYLEQEELNAMLRCFWLITTISLIFSVVAYCRGIYLVDFDNFNITIWYQNSGWAENRLGWVFRHKSTYALFLNLYIIFIINNRKEIFHSNKEFYISCLLAASILYLTSSKTGLLAGLLILAVYILYYNNTKNNSILLFFILPLVPYFVGAFWENLSATRDISTLGNRLYIWPAFWSFMKSFPCGIGKDFFEVTFKVNGELLSNFHNTFLNQIMKYSWLVGGLNILFLLTMLIVCFKDSQNLVQRFMVIMVFVILMCDNVLDSAFFSLFLFFVYISFVGNSVRKEMLPDENWDNCSEYF